MIRIIVFAFVLCIISGGSTVYARSCLPAPATTGLYKVKCDTFDGADGNKTFYMFHPVPDTVSPLLVFCPAFNVEGPHDYQELIDHLTAAGNHLLFVPARRISFTRNKIRSYDLGISGIAAAVQRWPGIDTTRIGVIGHGFGGGAVPALTRALRVRKWGSRGTLMYIMSPWYLYSIDERLMAAFPDKVAMVVQTFADDNLNDPKIAADIYAITGVAPQRKLYLLTGGIETDSCRIRAGFATPFGDRSTLDEWNMLDLQGVCRPLDAALAAVFSGDTADFRRAVSRAIAQEPRSGAAVKPVLTVVDSPASALPRGIWINQWNSPRNPRIETSKIKFARKTYFRGKTKKVAQIAKYIVKTTTTPRKPGVDDESEENPIGNGFGSEGLLGVREERFPNPLNPVDTVSFFYPDGPGPVPVVFFLHGYNNGKTDYYSQFINHIVSNGYALIFSPYPTFPSVDGEATVMEKYRLALGGFDSALHRFAGRIDTTHIGIFGQSFGAGAVPWLAKQLIVEREFGKNGAFLFVSAPWYMFGITDADLKAIPASTKLLITIYDDDVFNDHQMAVDLFTTVSIPPSEKCFMTMYSDTFDNIILPANHFVPYGSKNIYGVMDNLDYFGVFRHFDALAAYTFTGDSTAKEIALGGGTPDQCYMGEWPDGTPVRPLGISTAPKALHPMLQYMFSWDNRLNPRRGGLKVPFDKRAADRLSE